MANMRGSKPFAPGYIAKKSAMMRWT